MIGVSSDNSAVITYDAMKAYTVKGIIEAKTNIREEAAICHFCGDNAALPPMSGVLIHSKPQKWALIHGGTRRQPKRFFICDKCAKSVANKADR